MNEKKEYGQFFTSDIIADLMVKWLLKENPQEILDPAVGGGIFLKKAENYSKNIKKYAFEIDEKMITEFNKNNKFDVQLYHKDYLLTFSDKKFDAIACNPPYHKFQEIKNRKQYIDLLRINYGIHLSGYTNECIYFLIKSINELKENGKCCFIIPYEFLNTGYGRIVKQYLLDKKIVKAIMKFDYEIKLFDDATTTSCILFIENTPHTGINFIDISNQEDLYHFDLEAVLQEQTNIFYPNESLNPKEKWLQYFKKVKNSPYKNLTLLKNVAKVKRGIATGNNDYFALDKNKIRETGLSENVCVPCITKSSYIKGSFLTNNIFEDLVESNKKMYIFDGTKSINKNDNAYIKYGEANKYHESYLTSHRTPWYSIEEKKPAPILLSVFNRNKIKVVRNEMMIKNLTTFHGLFFNENTSEEDINLTFCYLLTPIAQEILKMNKREYGEGLDKFEPNDLNNSYILDVSQIPNADKNNILEIYEEMKENPNGHYIEELNQIFTRIIQ